MTFNAKIVIDGICSFVPNQEISPFGRQPLGKSPDKMWVLIPDARRRRKKTTGLDGKELATHYPVLRFDSADLQARGTMDLPDKIVTPIRYQNVAIIPEPINNPDNKFSIRQDGGENDFRHGVHIREISKKFINIDPECFKDNVDNPAVHDLVLSRIFLDQGKISTCGLNKVDVWKFSDSLGAQAEPRLLSNKVAVDFTGLTKLTIRLTRFGDHVPRDIVFSRVRESIDLGNLCDECLLPGMVEERLPPRQRDDDFRWLFELCSDRKAIRKKLKKFCFWTSSLPVPERITPVAKGGGSRLVECMRMTYAAAPEHFPEVADRGITSVAPPVIKADSIYHRQSGDTRCGAAAAMMILGDTEVGLKVEDIDQEAIYTLGSNSSIAPWHIDPTVLSVILNQYVDSVTFGFNLEDKWEDGCKNIIAALIEHKVPPAVVVEKDDHWVIVESARVDADPEKSDFVLHSFVVRDPWCAGDCLLSHSMGDKCDTYSGKVEIYSYYEWDASFRGSRWVEKKGSATRVGFPCITKKISRKLHELKAPEKTVFNVGNLDKALEGLAKGFRLGEDELAALGGTDLEGPMHVLRLDDESDSYSLFGFVRDGEVVAQVKVDRESRVLQRFLWEGEGSKEFSVFSRRAKNLGCTLLEVQEKTGGVKLRDVQPSKLPPLVWLACDESRSPFLPFFDLSTSLAKIYIRVDGSLLPISGFSTYSKGG